jgi:hypothetical protein
MTPESWLHMLLISAQAQHGSPNLVPLKDKNCPIEKSANCLKQNSVVYQESDSFLSNCVLPYVSSTDDRERVVFVCSVT